MSGAVVVVGSLHYDIMLHAPDRPRRGETVTGERWYPKFGGKGGNQAVAAARAGAETRFVGAVGTDNFGPYMIDGLADAGISDAHILRSTTKKTGMSVAIIDAGGDYGAVIVSGANADISLAHLSEPALWAGASVLILQNEIPSEINLAAAERAKAAGLTVCLNAAPSRDMPDTLLALVDILIVNSIEAEDLCGIAVGSLTAAERAAVALLARCETVIVTAGGDGLVLARRDQPVLSVPALPVTVISTHGAGDMFVGTLCAALAEGADLASACQEANAASARHVST